MKSLAPNFFVHDMDKTIAFYKMLGFEVTAHVPEQGDLVWAMLVSGQVTIMIQTYKSLENALPDIHRTDGGSLLLYINVEDINALFNSVKDKVPVLVGLEKTFYGATEFSILDVNGYVLTFAEHAR